jgi:hypothetical protein
VEGPRVRTPQVSVGRDRTVSGIEECTPSADRGVEDDLEEEHIEKLFRQLRAIPNPEKPRVHRPEHGSECLFWVRKELVKDQRIRPEDCYPVGRGQRFSEVPVTLSWSRDIWPGGREKPTYVEVLRRVPMADGGRWVWQADRPPRAPVRGRPQRGRGAYPQGQNRPPLPPPPKMQKQGPLEADQGTTQLPPDHAQVQ